MGWQDQGMCCTVQAWELAVWDVAGVDVHARQHCVLAAVRYVQDWGCNSTNVRRKIVNLKIGPRAC